MIKIPATIEGLKAITETIAAGISVNVTLIFSLERHRQVINAYLTGLEKAKAAGHRPVRRSTPSHPSSSRGSTPKSTTGSTRSARMRRWRSRARPVSRTHSWPTRCSWQSFESERAEGLLAAGANKQRPLWASTGVKDPSLPDTLYVTELAAPGVVNTMPEKTLEATFDHGVIEGDTVTGSYAAANEVLDAIAELGISYDEVTELLEKEGVEKFVGLLERAARHRVGRRWRRQSMSFHIKAAGAARRGCQDRVPQPGRRPGRARESPSFDDAALGPGCGAEAAQATRLDGGGADLAAAGRRDLSRCATASRRSGVEPHRPRRDGGLVARSGSDHSDATGSNSRCSTRPSPARYCRR